MLRQWDLEGRCWIRSATLGKGRCRLFEMMDACRSPSIIHTVCCLCSCCCFLLLRCCVCVLFLLFWMLRCFACSSASLLARGAGEATQAVVGFGRVLPWLLDCAVKMYFARNGKIDYVPDISGPRTHWGKLLKTKPRQANFR